MYLTINTNTLIAADVDLERRQLEARVNGQYQVIRELGRGGMGVVFLARDVALHRTVAIKVLRHEFVTSDDYRARFRREARLTARLSHPGIVPVYTFGEHDNLVYIVMKYVHGESLAERLRRSGKLPAKEVTRILRDLSAILHHAHGEGLVHRDIKAENVLIEHASGRAFLTDFGVAMLRDSSPDEWERTHASGTPHYMSPEQAAGETNLDGRSDLYSLGVLGYQMLSGMLPFNGTNFASLAAQHIVRAHVPLAEIAPSTPQPLADAIEKCLSKERNERWRSGADLLEALAPATTSGTWTAAKASAGTSKGWFRMMAGFVLAMTPGAMR